MKAVFESEFQEHLHTWIANERRTALKIMELVADIQRTPFDGLGKPEPLKHQYKGYWSRRITQEHRLVYKVEEQEIRFISCYGHYL
jgi:toxin YoeB